MAKRSVIETFEATFLCKLPDWVDGRTKITVFSNPRTAEEKIVIADPRRPPMFLNRETKTWEPIKP